MQILVKAIDGIEIVAKESSDIVTLIAEDSMSAKVDTFHSCNLSNSTGWDW